MTGPRTMPVPPPRQEGFGLVELLLAVVVASVGALAVAGVAGAVARQISLGRADAEMTLAAADAAAEVRRSLPGTVNETTSRMVNGAAYTVTTEALDLGEDLQGLTVKVVNGTDTLIHATRLVARRAMPPAP